jgi:hypothetical protein
MPSIPLLSYPTSFCKTPTKYSFKSKEYTTISESLTTTTAIRTTTFRKVLTKTSILAMLLTTPTPLSFALLVVSSSILSNYSNIEFTDLIDFTLHTLTTPVSMPISSKKSRRKASSKK